MNFIIFKNHVTQYGALHHFRKNLTLALQKQGAHTLTLDLKEEGTRLLQKIYQNPPDFTLAFNGLRPISGQYFLSDRLEIPHIAWLVDASYYFPELALSPYNILISPDQTSADQLTEWGSKNSHFLPHAFALEEARVSEHEKIYPITFLGSLMDPEEILQKWEAELPKNVKQDLMDASDRILETPDLTIIKAFEEIQREEPFFAKLTPAILFEIVRSLDYLVRAKDRLKLLEGLKDFPVHLFGNAIGKKRWEDLLDFKTGCYVLHPSVEFEASLDIIRQSQVLLNSSPMFKYGAHERIFNGLGVGTLVASNETPWIKQNFTSGQEILTYQSTHLAPFLEELNALLLRPSELQKLARAGQKTVLEHHTWDVRAKSLLTILESYINRE